MSWGITAKKAKNRPVISQPPVGELNEAMRPVSVVEDFPKKRGRPKSVNGYDAQLNIRCQMVVKKEFQMLCVEYGVEYSVMLKQCIDAFKFMGDD